MAVRVRKNVATLDPWGPELDWYGKAVAELRTRPLNDPRGWRFWAAVHGRMTGKDPYALASDRDPVDRDIYWDQCQHQTWFFLSWHRGYLAAFEGLIADTVVRLGGPADWALPYWNYSDNAASRIMPRAFCDEYRPDGTANPLWLEWGRTSDGDLGLDDDTVSIECLNHGVFEASNTGGENGFAGPVTGFMHFGSLVGLPSGRVEDAPHNLVHGGIGGLMGHPDYAALDPIFWLHHANIDRLWEVWRGRWPHLADPTETAWLDDVAFAMHDALGRPWSFTSRDTLNTTALLHGYVYDALPQPPGPAPLQNRFAMKFQMRATKPELAGANDERLSLASGQGSTRLSVRPPRNALKTALFAAEVPLQAFLNVEQMTGRGAPGNYRVYVATSGHDPVLAGTISTFGIEKASSLDADHGGNGLQQVLDITRLVDALGLAEDGETTLDVTIQKAPRRSSDENLPFDTSGDSVIVGRVSIYFA